MKSEFLLAFNEICESRGLPKEVVIDALKTALITAYKRNTNVSNSQGVEAEIDPRTGEPTIYAEKEVVDSIFDNRTEVLLNEARQRFPEAELGDMVMVISTPENFGRIAAQTAKQVILQRVREAERDQLFEDFSAREGEIVNGTVQSVSGQHITIGLGRTEAILPKNQQVPGEKYRPHDKIRVFVLEVRKSSRGPQIVVSRNHRNLLRRLLELEVPEIYNGQVDIKSIAREAGARSKVAVMALQPGIDPVGACVGMRGVRIQSIVRELSDEKIDVIEWAPDQKTFIAKALSPARVSHVFLEENPEQGRTASVIVPDDQLSLAIGKEGQNARLAAKLTAWRIDIKSLTEAAGEALANLANPMVDPAVARNKELINQVELILGKKEANRPITAEDYTVLNRLVAGVEGRIIAARNVEHERLQKARAAARKLIPEPAWQILLPELQLSTRLENILIENGIANVGDLMLNLGMSEDNLLNLEGFGEKSLEEVRQTLAAFDWSRYLPEQAELTVETELVAGAEAEKAEAAEAEAPAEVELVAEAATPAEESIAAEEPAAMAEEPLLEEEAEEAEFVPALEDLGRSLVEVATEPAAKTKDKKVVVVVQPASKYDDGEQSEASRQRKGKPVVGNAPAKKKKKGGRRREEWSSELDDLNFDFGDEG